MGPSESWPHHINPRTRAAAEERAIASLRRGLAWAAVFCAVLAGTLVLSHVGVAP